MLHQRDFILRLIEQMGQALATMLDRLLDRPVDELADVEAELSAMAHRAGLDLEIARRLAPESLHLMVGPAGEADPGRCWLLAELLFLHGIHAERAARPESAQTSWTRSLHLYRLVRPEWRPVVELPPAAGRIEELERRLAAPPPAAGPP